MRSADCETLRNIDPYLATVCLLGAMVALEAFGELFAEIGPHSNSEQAIASCVSLCLYGMEQASTLTMR